MINDDELWRYFEHLKSFFELLDLTLKVSVYSGEALAESADIESDVWPNLRWTGANYFPLEESDAPNCYRMAMCHGSDWTVDFSLDRVFALAIPCCGSVYRLWVFPF